MSLTEPEHANVTSTEVPRRPRAAGLLLGGLLTGVLLASSAFGMWTVMTGPEQLHLESRQLTYSLPVTAVDIVLDAAESSLADSSVDLNGGRSGVVTVERQTYWERTKPLYEERVVGRTLQIRSSCPRSLLSRFRQCRTFLRLEIPPGVAVRVTTNVSLVSCDQLTGDLDLTTSSGDITVSETRGRLRARSQGGTITGVALAGAETDVRTEAADVDLRFAAVPDRVQAVARNGDVGVWVPRAGAGANGYRVRADTLRGGYDVGVADNSAGRHTIFAHTDNGNVTVRTTN